jgi:hypothetical protein
MGRGFIITSQGRDKHATGRAADIEQQVWEDYLYAPGESRGCIWRRTKRVSPLIGRDQQADV